VSQSRSASGGSPVIDGAVYDARIEADEIVAQAHLEADQIRQVARRQGETEAREQAVDLLAQAAAKAHDVIESAERELIPLAIGIAEKIVRRSIELHSDTVVEIARSAIAECPRGVDIELRVAPQDVGTATDVLAGDSGSRVRVVGDGSIERGGCVVHAGGIVVDGRLDSQLATLARALETAGAGGGQP
jgi:flagellar biosynthesis/type III secretory pathway protein FliH